MNRRPRHPFRTMRARPTMELPGEVRTRMATGDPGLFSPPGGGA